MPNQPSHEHNRFNAEQGQPNIVFFGPDGLRAGWSILLYLAIVAAFTAASFALLPRSLLLKHGTNLLFPQNALLTHGVPLLGFLLAAFVLSRIEHRPFRCYGLQRPGSHRLRQAVAGFGWGAISLGLLIMLLRATGHLTLQGAAISKAAALRFGIAWLASFLLVAVSEEFSLRGYMQFTLARGLSGLFQDSPHRRTAGFWLAAILLSAVFGGAHFNNPGETPLGLLNVALMGLVFCFSLWRTGSLWWIIGWHAAWDWAQSFIFGVADSGLYSEGRLATGRVAGNPILSGGATGPEGSILMLAVMLLTVLVILLTLPQEEPPITSGIIKKNGISVDTD